MTYTIGEAAKKLNVAPSTLRYYDKEGLIPFIERSKGGIRVFKEADFGTLKTIECLKSAGMPLKDIKQFIDWCSEGDATLEERYQLFIQQKQNVEDQIRALEKTLSTVNFKCWYYKTALDAGTTKFFDTMNPDELPEDIQQYLRQSDL